MYELNRIEIEQISGAKPLGFFSSYVLAQQGYNAFSSVGFGAGIGMICALTAAFASTTPVTALAMFNLAMLNLVNSAAGFYLSTLLPPKLEKITMCNYENQS